ncbi:MAG: cupin domain-containing protein [Candidatus Latescibacteria bacterium]|nr:cupin domain-containing protein [Candidatus Latescibacterota bacterium]
MKRRNVLGTLAGLGGMILSRATGYAAQTGTPVFGHTDPGKYQGVSNAHDGAGTLPFMVLLDHEVFDTNFLFVHRAEVPPKTGIGEHIHRNMEEMYYIFNGVAQFTVNGQTAELPGPCCVLCPKGSSHGIYNHTEETLQWLNVAVSVEKGKGDAINYKDDLSNKQVVSPTPFLWAPIDRSLLKPAAHAHLGKGSILFKRLWANDSFQTNWDFTDHCVLPPDTSIGYHQHNAIEEIYYLVKGRGRMTVNDHTFDVGPGDAVPCTLHDSHGLYNNSSEDILLIVNSCGSKGKGVYDVNNWDNDLSKK